MASQLTSVRQMLLRSAMPVVSGGAIAGSLSRPALRPASADKAKAVMATSFERFEGVKSLLFRRPECWAEIGGKAAKAHRSLVEQRKVIDSVVAPGDFPLIAPLLDEVEVMTREAESLADVYGMLRSKAYPKAVVFGDFCAKNAHGCLIRYQLESERIDRGDLKKQIDFAQGCLKDILLWKNVYERCTSTNHWTYPEELSREVKRDFYQPSQITEYVATLEEDLAILERRFEIQEAALRQVEEVQQQADVFCAEVASFNAWVEDAMAAGDDVAEEEVYPQNFLRLRELVDQLVIRKAAFDASLEVRVEGKLLAGFPEARRIKEAITVQRKTVEFLEKAVTLEPRIDFFALPSLRLAEGPDTPSPHKSMLVEIPALNRIGVCMNSNYLSTRHVLDSMVEQVAGLSISDA